MAKERRKALERKEIEQAIAHFLAKGGEIEKVPSQEIKPLKERRVIKGDWTSAYEDVKDVLRL